MGFEFGEATAKKLEQMWLLIGKVQPDVEQSTLRANMNHTLEKILIFIGTDMEPFVRKAEQLEEMKSGRDWSNRISNHHLKKAKLNQDLMRHMCKLCPSGWRLEIEFGAIGEETEDSPLGFKIVCHNGDDNLVSEHEDFNVAVLDMIRLFMIGRVYPLG